MVVKTTERLITAEEFAQMPESRGAELIRGRIVWPGTPEEPVNGWLHANIVAGLSAILLNFVIPRKLGQVYSGDPGMILRRDPDTTRGPDVAFIRTENVPDVRPDGFSDVIADLVIEVVSPNDSAADVEGKALRFLDAGVRLVWVVNPIGRTITEYRSRSQVRVHDEGDSVEGYDVLPGFRYAVADIFDVQKSPAYPVDQPG